MYCNDVVSVVCTIVSHYIMVDIQPKSAIICDLQMFMVMAKFIIGAIVDSIITKHWFIMNMLILSFYSNHNNFVPIM